MKKNPATSRNAGAAVEKSVLLDMVMGAFIALRCGSQNANELHEDTMNFQTVEDALDLAECAVHDKLSDPNEREFVLKVLAYLRTLAFKEFDKQGRAREAK